MLVNQWQGFTGLPDYPNAPQVPTHLKNLFDFLAARAVPRYANQSARDAELPTPVNGQLAWSEADQILYIRSSSGWRVAWQDTRWVTLTYASGAAGFHAYTSGATEPKIRRVGDTVELMGAGAPNTAGNGTANTETTAFLGANLEQRFRPTGYDRVYRCAGSSSNQWTLRVNTDGSVRIRSYGPEPTTTGTWLPYAVTWLQG